MEPFRTPAPVGPGLRRVARSRSLTKRTWKPTRRPPDQDRRPFGTLIEVLFSKAMARA
jgi:hypothetical protein